jgi:hypothetical protein
MNERIQQLERQATETVKCGLNGTSTAESFNRKKFAELIVRECAEVGSKFSQAHPLDIQYQIKRHFGVEE